MWSSEDDVILSAVSYFIDAKINNKTKTLLKPISIGDPPPIFHLSEGDAYSKNCGNIFITINQLLVFHCAFCNNEYGTLFDFLQHLSATHLHNQDSIVKTEIINAAELDDNEDTAIIEYEPVPEYLSLEVEDESIVDNVPSSDSIINAAELSENEETAIIEYEAVPQYLSLEVQGETIVDNAPSSSKDTKDNSKPTDVINAAELNDNEETAIIEYEPVPEYLSLEVEGEAIADNVRSSTKVTKVDSKPTSKRKYKKKPMVKNKNETTRQNDKKDVVAVDVEEATGLERCDIESERDYEDETMSSLEDLELIMKTKKSHLNKTQVYKCDKCDRDLSNKRSYDQHILSHSNVKNYKCTQCDATFKYDNSVRLHTMRRHTNEKRYSCDQCSMRFTTMTEAKSHKVSHTDERPYNCSICGKGFKYSSSLTPHMRLHNNETENLSLGVESVQEWVDNIPNSSKKTKKKPIVDNKPRSIKGGKNEEVDDVDERDYQDESSISSLEDLELIRKTEKSHKNKTKVYECDKCDRVLSNERSHRHHLLSHSNVKNFKCTQCDTKFKYETSLRLHIMRRHTNEKKHGCDLCDKLFVTRTEVKIHRRSHTGERPYICNICGKSFKSSSTLAPHMRRHSNVRNAKCDICEKTFLDNAALKYHMAGHSSERPFVCTHCSASFARVKTLRQHMKLHTNAREYACTLCDKSFNQSPALISHMNNNHKVLEYEKV